MRTPCQLPISGKRCSLRWRLSLPPSRCLAPNACCNSCRSCAVIDVRSAVPFLPPNLISVQRTLDRDIASLQSQGAEIAGEAGIGSLQQPGFMLPPPMFSEDEIADLVLGSRGVAERTDEPLQRAAQDALAKIAAVLPPIFALIWMSPRCWSVPARPSRPDRPARPASPGHPAGTQTGYRLRRPEGVGNAAHDLADWPGIFRSGARRRRVVRIATGVPLLPGRPGSAP